jgi:ribose transport system substrate-binding protein
MKAKSWKLIIILTAVMLFGAACGSDDDAAVANSGGGGECTETFEVAYANLATFILYFRDLEAGLADFGAANCWNFQAADAGYVIENQVAQLEDFVTQGVDLIIASPGDRVALTAAYQVAAAAGIPILSTGDRVDDETLEIGFIGTDWREEGRKQIQWMVEQMNGKGQLARIGGPGASEYVEKRKEGFEATMAANAGIDLVFNQSADSFTQEEGLRLAQDALTANPDLRAIWADSDALALGAAQAVTEAGIDHDDFLITGTDGEPLVFDQIRSGDGVDATVALRGYQWGTFTAEIANQFLTTGSTGQGYFIQAPTTLVDSDSIKGVSNDGLR